MNYKSLLKETKFIGKTHSTRNEFYIYTCGTGFLILTIKDSSSGYFKIISNKTVSFVHKKLAGIKSISSTDGFKKCSKSKYVKDSFMFREAMYILCAKKLAKITKVASNTMYFGINKYA